MFEHHADGSGCLWLPDPPVGAIHEIGHAECCTGLGRYFAAIGHPMAKRMRIRDEAIARRFVPAFEEGGGAEGGGAEGGGADEW